VDVFPETPEVTAGWIPGVVEAGAAIIGGCCGTTPEHIMAIGRVLTRIENGVRRNQETF
jgi:methionine synthase I (cobalamin-dependent)